VNLLEKTLRLLPKIAPVGKADVDGRQLRRLPLPSGLNGYDPSRYTLKVSQKISVLLTIDEDPVFGQVIFTLFRSVNPHDLDRAYNTVAKSLYQELLHHHQETARS
jgi:hypothetical protein